VAAFPWWAASFPAHIKFLEKPSSIKESQEYTFRNCSLISKKTLDIVFRIKFLALFRCYLVSSPTEKPYFETSLLEGSLVRSL
jgi:hypothetical protein